MVSVNARMPQLTIKRDSRSIFGPSLQSGSFFDQCPIVSRLPARARAHAPPARAKSGSELVIAPALLTGLPHTRKFNSDPEYSREQFAAAKASRRRAGSTRQIKHLELTPLLRKHDAQASRPDLRDQASAVVLEHFGRCAAVARIAPLRFLVHRGAAEQHE